jgi:hypothetical protein
MYKIETEAGLWDAWVDSLLLDTLQINTLYVMGDVVKRAGSRRAVLQKIEDHDHPFELHLELRSGVSDDRGYPEEVLYTEVLDYPRQYHQVFIHYNNEILSCISDIEIVGNW